MTENEIKEPEAEFGDAFAEATSPEPSDTGATAPEEAPAAPAPKEEPAAPKEEAAPAAPEPKAQPAEVPVDYRALYEKERQRADSMQGLYQSRMDEYRQRVEAAERQRAEQPAVPGFEPDEIEKEEIEAFRKKHPEIAKDTVDGKKAAAWQKLLVNRGEDELLTLYEVNRSTAEDSAAEIREELNRRATNDHYAAIEAKHPGWMQLLANPTPKNQDDIFSPDFSQFVMGLPFQEGQLAVRIIQGGTSDQVVALISAFKDWQGRRSAPPAAPQKKPQPDLRRVASAAPVSGRSAGAPPAAPDPNDFGAAWAEATSARR